MWGYSWSTKKREGIDHREKEDVKNDKCNNRHSAATKADKNRTEIVIELKASKNKSAGSIHGDGVHFQRHFFFS